MIWKFGFVSIIAVLCALAAPLRAAGSDGAFLNGADAMSLAVSGERLPSDSVATATSAAPSQTRWIGQLFDNGFRLNDSAIYYPRFPRFLLSVYRWGDRTFNSYDKDYVVGTGKNWKLLGKSYAWMETQNMYFPKDAELAMHSNLFMDAGGYISFMAVSVGYMWNMDRLFDHDTKRRTFLFDFTTSRFSVSLSSVSSEGGMILTKLGDYNNGRSFRYEFDGASVENFNLDAYYFFNHNRYSHAAAYSFSKYQLRSAGTPLAGFSMSESNTKLNFSSLPEDMLANLPLERPDYTFHHRDYTALGGYGYNWVLRPRRWLLNATGIIALGYKRTYQDATDQNKDMMANNFRVSMAAVYNTRKLFAALHLRYNGSLYFNSSFTHFSALASATLTVGMRF